MLMSWLAACSILLLSLQLVQPLAIDPKWTVQAFYYMWYGEPSTDSVYKHWDHEQLPHWNPTEAAKYPSGKLFNPPDSVHSPFYPWRGPYSSRNETIIHEHVQELLAADINVMAVSWWGPSWRAGTTDTQGVNTDLVLHQVAAVVEQHPDMKLALHMEPYPGRTVATFREDLQHLQDTLGHSSALLRIDGLPVYYVYDSYRIPPQEWATLFAANGNATVRSGPLDGVFLGLWLDRNDGDQNIAPGGFDGFYTYFASEAVSFGSQPDNWPTLRRWASEHDKVFIASVGPGYDDSRIRPWNAGATRPRREGARYTEWWEAAINAGADGVSITSFNEWGEGTQIEPAKSWRSQQSGHVYTDYGSAGPFLYMNLTKEESCKFKRQLAGDGGGVDQQQTSDEL